LKRLVEYLESFVVVGLVLAGVGGISYSVFRDGGWMERFFGNLWTVGTGNLIVAATVLIAAVSLFKLWHGSTPIHTKTSIIPNLVLYALMAAGVYFVGRYAITGTV
jgi:hypothetical protein